MTEWIEKKYKTEYDDCYVRGLRLKFYDGITAYEREEIVKFCKWIRENYFFPIRVNVCFVAQKKFKSPDDGHLYSGIFYSPDEIEFLQYPRIFVATEFKDAKERYEVLFTLAHELTHYYQWNFMEDEKKSDRSLEIMANRWSTYILKEYGGKMAGEG